MKQTIFFIVLVVAFFAGIIYVVGLPDSEFYHFEEAGLVCKKWSMEWSVQYKHSRCWNIVEVERGY